MNLENMRSERNQIRKATNYMIPFLGSVQNMQIHGDRKYRLVTAKDGTGGMSTSQYTVSFWGGKNVL
mgnify:CR=1 FL=1|uniref:PRO2277 n=1 Tax=Homo sapiens TaxID=9606 RepID=Q9H3A4_HUMAN|nr:PRO2277 [Homo sapiens]